jgi:hypothetical protein
MDCIAAFDGMQTNRQTARTTIDGPIPTRQPIESTTQESKSVEEKSSAWHG